MSVDVVKYIRLETKDLELLLGVNDEGRLYQLHLGKKVSQESDESFKFIKYPGTDAALKPISHEIYSGEGRDNFYETCISIRHADGAISTQLDYVSHTQTKVNEDLTVTEFVLRDKIFPVTVKVIYKVYYNQNIFSTHTEISHEEKGTIELRKYFSGAIYFVDDKYVLNEYSGDWGSEFQRSTQTLQVGKKVIDTKFASRSAMYSSPFFELGLGHEPRENEGTVVLGHIAWTGNFSMNFEVDNTKELRVICGINPNLSNYYLEPGKVLETPEFIYTISYQGLGYASRNFHDYVRKYSLKDGLGPRLTLLNNWDATGFDFDEPKLIQLMKDAKELGVDMFVLDDGWFGNKYPRINDKNGLGDWEAMKSKLPHGLPALSKAAAEIGIKFGLWLEPEMVSCNSELIQKHPDWVTLNPDRTPFYHRYQLVLDLSNPEVQDFIFGVFDRILTENPDINYIKWDCNSITTNLYSKYLGDKQTHYFYEYTRGFYAVCDRIIKKFPALQMMLCSGGGARCDLKALQYFTEFWPSDNSDPVQVLYMHHATSMIFPAKATASHVTEWNKIPPYKFRIDVAFQGKFGYDIDPEHMDPKIKEFCKEAAEVYNHLRPAILEGDLYRLYSPYDGPHSAANYVSKDGKMVVLFAYDLYPRLGDKCCNVKLQGLDPEAKYLVKEVNLVPGTESNLDVDGKVLKGDYLMTVGINAFTWDILKSRVIELTRQ